MYIKFIKLLICLLTLKYVKSQNYEGDLCKMASTGISGQCKLISTCPSAIHALQNHKIYPQTCGFATNHEVIVCCTGSEVSSFTPKPPPSPTTRTTRTPPRTIASIRSSTSSVRTTTTKGIIQHPLSVGDKSKQKCKEYEKYVYTQSAVFGGLGNDANPLSDDCALGEVENIVGGKPSKPKEFPHMALLGFQGDTEKKWKCGGSLISEKFVLTAAHCLYHQEYGDVKYIKVGDLVTTSNTDNARPQEFNVKSMHKPPNHTPSSPYNDIALLELDKMANLNNYVRPACLNVNSRLTNHLAIASGWGQTAAGSAVSESLLKVTLEMFTKQECRNNYANLREGIKDDTQICAGSHNDSRDTCHGDSGGPLQIVSATTYCSYEIIGVTSFGKRCGEANSPGIYTRVSAYIKWIEDIVWP